ncbi:TetR/AcrR family transcriptional regulator [Micromonospora sp. NPDC047465]|uniref:TetR/AcrR family transcriptional regulator n=1 Tax=Micromonospora sp. NPDC047465 TaxID=3154813 RepID=UPI0033D3A786
MPRQTKQELDDEIINCAATLFARHGFKETSIQRIADAVGYSKTGLLHRYPSKKALQQAVLDGCVAEMRAISTAVADLPPGPSRDRETIEALVDLALRRPGFMALLLSILNSLDASDVAPYVAAIGDALSSAFASAPDDLARAVRIVGALGALAVAAVTCHDRPPSEVRPLLAAVSYDALGHPRPTAN